MTTDRHLQLFAARQTVLGEIRSGAAGVDANPIAAPLADARLIPNDDVSGRRWLDRLDNGLGQAHVSGRMSLSHRSLLSSGPGVGAPGRFASATSKLDL